MVFAFLGMNVLVVATTVFLALHYKAPVVDRAYDVTAQHWDQVKALHDRQAALGWTCTISVDASVTPHTLLMRLLDSAKQPVQGANIHVTCFHNAHAAEPVTLAPTPAADAYAAPIPALRDGLWTFRIRATTAAEEAQFTLEREARSLTADTDGGGDAGGMGGGAAP